MVQLADLFSVPEMGLICNVADYFERNHIDYHPEILFRDVKVSNVLAKTGNLKKKSREIIFLLHGIFILFYFYFFFWIIINEPLAEFCKKLTSCYAQNCCSKCR